MLIKKIDNLNSNFVLNVNKFAISSNVSIKNVFLPAERFRSLLLNLPLFKAFRKLIYLFIKSFLGGAQKNRL